MEHDYSADRLLLCRRSHPRCSEDGEDLVFLKDMEKLVDRRK
ncbi:hypothetical protein [Hungatella hathewayi]|jgi:hypothetical protein|nr:hypothetical protein [Hungatella hathewayi]